MSLRRSPAVAVAVAVLVVAGFGAALAHQSARVALPARTAIRDALHDPATVRALHGVSRTRSTASAVDGQLERVSFYAGARIVAEVAVRADGTVQQRIYFRRLPVPYGDWIAYEPVMLLGLSLLFVLMAGVAPLRRQRNVDVLAVLSLIAPVVLLQYRYVGASVLSAVPGLGYLMLRCGWLALGPGSRPAAPSTPLFERVTVGWEAARRVRLLRIVVVATAVVFALVGISSPDAVDVIYAVMEGATRLIHGLLPYGHLPGDVIHGDTYRSSATRCTRRWRGSRRCHRRGIRWTARWRWRCWRRWRVRERCFARRQVGVARAVSGARPRPSWRDFARH